MIELRPYQTDAIQAVAAGYRRGIRRPLIGLPTGTGKTCIFSKIAEGARSKGGRVCIMAHRDELLSQAAEKLLMVAPHLARDIGFVQAGRNETGAGVVIASVQTLARERRRQALIGSGAFSVVVVDEAHHAAADSYQDVLAGLGCLADDGPLTIGVTATPQRADSRDLGDTWQEVVYHRDLLSMIREGWLCDLRGIQIRLAGFDPTALHSRGGDYQSGEVEQALTAAEAPRHTVGAWLEHAADRKTLIFTPTVALADQMVTAYRDAGIVAANISRVGGDRDARRQMLADFKAGRIQVLANALLLTEGFDEPSVDCIVVARPTKSQPLYVQMVGRGTRTSPGKSDCLILDMVGATDRMDLTTLPRMMGLGDGADVEKTIAERGVTEAAEAEIRAGRIVARKVDLFDRNALHWNRAAAGLWILSTLEGAIHLQDMGDGLLDVWRVTLHPRDRDQSPRILDDGHDQGYAMGVAEAFARRSIAEAGEDAKLAHALVDRNAAWRQRPASEGQLAVLRRMGHPITLDDQGLPTIRKGEASDLIGARSARRAAARGKQ